jgi:hypothetical protein
VPEFVLPKQAPTSPIDGRRHTSTVPIRAPRDGPPEIVRFSVYGFVLRKGAASNCRALFTESGHHFRRYHDALIRLENLAFNPMDAR